MHKLYLRVKVQNVPKQLKYKTYLRAKVQIVPNYTPCYSYNTGYN